MKSVNSQVRAREKEIGTATKEMVDTIERYFAAASFEFFDGHEAQPGQYAFDEYLAKYYWFDSWFERWVGLLEPDYDKANKLMKDSCKLIAPTIRQADEKTQDAWNTLSDSYGEVMFPVRRISFYLGCLVGMKFEGATREELTAKCQGFVAPLMYQARSNAEYEAKQRAEENKKDKKTRRRHG